MIEAAIRYELEKSTGDLTSADLGKVTKLTIAESKLTDVKDLEKLPALKSLVINDKNLTKLPTGLGELQKLEDLDLSMCKLTELKGLEKLTQLKHLWITGNPDLTKAQIDQLQKALPKCFIHSNPTK
ncbi:MAG: leucine-rich repeat domain-containing protein [Verrucomicrobia subdivision 3 bacterium]|nr:leucine-rich repeat domain-containing protein [Limisphaerales bacterium]